MSCARKAQALNVDELTAPNTPGGFVSSVFVSLLLEDADAASLQRSLADKPIVQC